MKDKAHIKLFEECIQAHRNMIRHHQQAIVNIQRKIADESASDYQSLNVKVKK